MYKYILFVCSLCLMLGHGTMAQPVSEYTLGGGGFKPAAHNCLAPQTRQAIEQHLDSSLKALAYKQPKATTQAKALQQVAFGFPLRLKAGLQEYGFHAISYQVDHNTGAGPKDYFCSTRTYGGHQGTDYFPWPFWWNQMDSNNIEIVAAAKGIIISKADGHFDRSCANNGNPWNAVYVQHTDGSVAWYGHMKKFSLTTKAVGDSVQQGEYLGRVGSSGNSSGPHLHFELHNSTGQTIDPYQGTCNPGQPVSWWTAQTPYIDAHINSLRTHSTVADFKFFSCAQNEITNEKTVFAPQDSIYFAIYLRDVTDYDTLTWTIRTPDSLTWFSLTAPYLEGTWPFGFAWLGKTIPANPAEGLWYFEINYKNKFYQRRFEVDNPLSSAKNTGPARQLPGITLFPNPVQRGATLQWAQALGAGRLGISDLQGRLLFNEIFRDGTTAIQLPVYLASGLYILNLQTQDKSHITKLLVVE